MLSFRMGKVLKRTNDLNGDEQNFLLHLLTDGFDLEEIHPWRLGVRRPLIDRFGGRYYAVVKNHAQLRVDDNPGVADLTGHGRFRTLDFLVGVTSHRGREEEDAVREKQVRFVRVKVPSGQLQMKDFSERFIRSVMARAIAPNSWR